MSKATHRNADTRTIERYLSHLRDERQLRPATVAAASQILADLSRWTQTPLFEITDQQLLDWQADQSLKLAPGTLRMRCSYLRTFYRWAVEIGTVAAHPSALELRPVEGHEPGSGLWVPTPADAPPASARLAPLWRQLVDQFCAHLERTGLAENTLHQHRRRVSMFAEHVGGDPSAVTRPQVLDWLSLAPSAHERGKRGESLRRFYGWASTNGYAQVNPTGRISQVGKSGPKRSVSPAPWAEAFDQWATYMRSAGRPPTTIHLRRGHLARIGRELGGIGPWEATAEDFVDWLASKRWVGETRRSHRTTLRSFYKWAVTFKYVTVDPTIDLPVIQVTRGLPRPAPDHRIKFALAGADSRMRLMILLAATMGLRRGEIAKMHTDDVTETGLIVWGKGQRKRLVPIPPIVAQALTSVPSGYVFPASQHTVGRPITAARVGKLMSEQLGDGLTAHMLRHRFATVAYAAERDVRAVQTLLGHSKIETTMIYADVSEASLATAVAAAAVL